MSLNKGNALRTYGTVAVMTSIGIIFHFFPTFFRRQTDEDQPKFFKDLTQKK